MKLAEALGDNQLDWLADYLFLGKPEQCRGRAVPRTNLFFCKQSDHTE